MDAELSFGHWIKQLRKALDLTQPDLARLVGCAVVTIQKIEEGRRRPSRQVAELLAEHLAIADQERAAFLQLARATQVSRTPALAEPLSAATPTNLPSPLTALIGRAVDVATVCMALDHPDVRLLTLVGPPGVGKTRLSIQAANDLFDQFSDGVWFVALASIHDPELVVPTIARVLGLAEAGQQPLIERLKTALRVKRVLLVLDNFEQIVDAAAPIAELLAACRQLKVLATSRVPLHVYGEHEYAVEPFALPDRASTLSVDNLQANEAIRLFVVRVQAFKPDFSLTLGNARAIVDICRQLDGVPLAIELAAARTRHFTPEALAAHLSSSDGNLLPLLGGGPRDLPARQQTLQNAIAWSYNLLDPAQQQFFRRMGIFAGGCTGAAAMALCGSTRGDELAVLLEQSLMRQQLTAQAEGRFSMLEMIREYALAQLAECGERLLVERVHASYFLEQAEDAQDEVAWLDRMEAEHDNLRAALCWALEHDASETGLRLCTALWWFWESHGYWREGRRWMERMLAAARDADPGLRIQALRGAGSFAWKQGDYAEASRLLRESLSLSRAAGKADDTARILLELGKTALDQGHYADGTVMLQESVALRRALDIPDPASLMHLGEIALAQQDYAQAQMLFEATLAECRDVGNTFFTARSLCLLGETALAQGDSIRAQTLLEQSLRLSRDVRHRRVVACALTAFAAGVGHASGLPAEHVRRAACIWGAAEALREDVGIFLPVPERIRYERYVAGACAQVSTGAWATAWAEGRAMSLEQAIAYALESSRLE